MRRRQKSVSRREMEVSLFPNETCGTYKGHAAGIKHISSGGCHLTDEGGHIMYSLQATVFKNEFLPISSHIACVLSEGGFSLLFLS